MVKAVTPRKAKEYEDSNGKSPFKEWLNSLADARTQVKITKAITQMEGGNFGDHKPITDGKGLQERRINYGPGYRIYYVTEGDKLIILFAGSDKSEQQKVIDDSKGYFKDYQERKKTEPVDEVSTKKSKRNKGKKRR
jgi:putative addiction module killer protein